MSDLMVDVQKLDKHFGPIHAVRGVSFQVRRGEVLGFLGPNGAGKSTTMKMLTCFLAPSAGTAKVCGFDILEQPRQVRQKIGYLAEGAPAYPDMTPLGFLRFIADVRGLGAGKQAAVDKAIRAVGLEGVVHQPIDTLSKGFKRRVGLAQAILHDPQVLILDEPTDGLDPNQKHEVRTLIQQMAKDKVIILSTHILEEVDAVCSRAVIIAKGTVIFDGTPAALEAKSSYHNAVSITVEAKDADAIEKALRKLGGVQAVSRETPAPQGKARFLVVPSAGQMILPDVAAMLEDNKWRFDELHAERGRLDEVFRTLTRGAGKETKAA